MKTLNQYITEAMNDKKIASLICPVIDEFTGLNNGYEKAQIEQFGFSNKTYYVFTHSSEKPNKTNPSIYVEINPQENGDYDLYCLFHKKLKKSGANKTITIKKSEQGKLEDKLSELLPKLQKEYEDQYGSTLVD